MPVVDVTLGGRPTVSSGSKTANLGIRLVSFMEALWRVAWSVITAATVVSDPVPAVVGTAKMVGILLRTLKSPCSCSTVFPFFTATAPMPLQQSIGEPPPKATMASQLFSLNSLSPSFTLISVGFGCTPSYTTYSTPSSSMALNKLSKSPSPMRTLSVTTSTFL